MWCAFRHEVVTFPSESRGTKPACSTVWNPLPRETYVWFGSKAPLLKKAGTQVMNEPHGGLQGYLAYKKTHPSGTLPYASA